MPHVLVTLVGENPASALIAARHFPVDEVVLLCTDRTAAIARVLEAQLGVPVVTHTWSNNPTWRQVQDEVVKVVDPQPDDEVLLDITGATKPMALGAWSGLRAAIGDRLRLVYLQPDGRLEDGDSGNVIDARVVIKGKEFVSWKRHGAVLKDSAWTGPLSSAAASFGERGTLARVLADKFGRDPGFATASHEARLDGRCPDLGQSAPRGFTREKGYLCEAKEDRFFKLNGWLEELCLWQAYTALDVGERLDVWADLSLDGGTVNGKTLGEIDVALTRGARLVAIEAKTHASERMSGTAQEAVSRMRETLGGFAHLFIVNPRWTPASIQALQIQFGRGVTLIGQGMLGAPFHAAIRAALGFNK
ncbi:MAG: hypothetical protein V4850_17685 [Myxococcota bacterium]